MRRLSVRARTLLALLTLTATGLAGSNVATSLALQHFLTERIDQQLKRQERPIVDMVQGRGRLASQVAGAPASRVAALRSALGRILPPGGYVAVSGPDSRLQLTYTAGESGREATDHPQSASRWRGLQPGQSLLATVPSSQPGASGYRLEVRRLSDGGLILIGQSLRDVDTTLRQLGLSEALISIGALAAVAGLGLWLVRLGLKPLERITATAEAIATGDLSHRAPSHHPGTEVGRLAAAFNSMLGQIQSSFAAQQSSEEHLRQFLADASHELRTPLTSLRGYAELFRRGADRRPDDLAKVMSRIEAEAARMGILVDDLMLLARLDQRLPLRRVSINLTALIEQAVEDARVIDPDRRIDLDAPSTSGMTLTGDPARLRQVIDNLLANVRLHTPRAAPARVTLRQQDRQAVVEIADAGPGIPPASVERIFERFYRADPGRSREQGGYGLGLAIVQSIVIAHGGTVRLLATGPRGSVFRVMIPS